MVRKITYREALNEALKEEMHRDERVFLIGLGIAERGGSFGVTHELAEQFGSERVIDTPISEASFTGMAVGAAIQGKRPVVELTFIDFSLLAMDMIVNQSAKYNFTTGGNVPLVIRTQGGAGMGLACQHSQSLEALFYHIPGLKIAVPSTPADAKGLLKTAIRDNGPVIFIEHKRLYDTQGEVSDGDTTIPFGQAEVRYKGSDCTIVSYSYMVHQCIEAVKRLHDDGISCDLIDLRTLVPMDWQTMLDSVAKTEHLVIVNEAVKRGSVASDISAWMCENAFDKLRFPIVRISGKVTPVPYNQKLERAIIPQVDDIVNGVKGILKR